MQFGHVWEFEKISLCMGVLGNVPVLTHLFLNTLTFKHASSPLDI